jgi:hypothetical protein
LHGFDLQHTFDELPRLLDANYEISFLGDEPERRLFFRPAGYTQHQERKTDKQNTRPAHNESSKLAFGGFEYCTQMSGRVFQNAASGSAGKGLRKKKIYHFDALTKV